MRVSECVSDALTAQGVEVVFGVMGHGNLLVIPTLAASGIAYYGARHEGNAVAMADGYARTSGRVGVCTVTQGPGLANTVTALTTAARARTPLVVLAGEGPNDRANFQRFDHDALFAVAGVPSLRIGPATVAAEIARAFDLARSTPGPVGVNMPLHLQRRQCQFEPPAEVSRRAPVAPTGAAIREAADIVARAQRPVILAGRGAVEAGARDDLVELAERIGAVLTTSLAAKGFFDGDPFALGVCGGFATHIATRVLRDADCVLAFGASLNSFTTDHGAVFAAAADIVQCDVSDVAIGAWTPATSALIGDAAVAARALFRELERHSYANDGFRTNALRDELAAWRPQDEFVDESTPGALDPRTAMIALEGILPRSRVVVVDGGNCQGFPSTYLSVPDPSCFVHPLAFGAIGCGLGEALGAAIARPDRLAVLAVGDGALMMSSSDLDSSVRFGVPLVVAVLNDNAFGAELHSLREIGLDDTTARLDNPSFAALGDAVGGRGIVVRSLEDFAGVAAQIVDLETLLVIDIHVRDLRATWNARLDAAWRQMIEAQSGVNPASGEAQLAV